MSCDEALPLLYDLVDGDIGRDGAIALARHLAACPACATKLSRIESAEGLFTARTAVAAPVDLPARVADAVRLARPGAERRKGASAWLAGAAMAAVAVAFLLAPGAMAAPDAAARLGAATVEWLSRFSTSFALSWSGLMAWLAAPAVLGGGVVLLSGLVVLQIVGSTALLAARRREGPRP